MVKAETKVYSNRLEGIDLILSNLEVMISLKLQKESYNVADHTRLLSEYFLKVDLTSRSRIV